MRLIKIIFLLFLTVHFSIVTGNAQGITLQSVDLIVLQMADHNLYESEYTGLSRLKSKQYQRYEQLINISTDEQLLNLAVNHTHAVVRLYAFKALKNRKISLPEKVMEQFKNDESTVTSFIGCIRSKTTIGQLVKTGFINH